MKGRGLCRLAVGALALALALTGCAGEERPVQPEGPAVPVQSLTTPPAGELQAFTLPCNPAGGFHPLTGGERINLVLGGLLYEGLFQMDEAFVPNAVLCSGHTVSEDGLVWRFSIREGVTFSDGSPLTAAEVAASLNLARGSALYGSRLTNLQSVKSVSGAVEVVLAAPNGGLPALLDIPIVKENGTARPLGTGPYVLTQEDKTLSLRARSGWWQNKPLPVEEIPLSPVRGEEELLRAFATRQASLIVSDLTGTGVLRFPGVSETMDIPTSTLLYLGFRCGGGACQELAVRQALQRSVDRDTLLTAHFSRHATPAVLPAPPGSTLYDPVLADRLGCDPEAAEKLLAAAGWSRETGTWTKGGRPLALTLLTATGNSYKLAAAKALTEQLNKAGFRVTLKALPWEQYQTALREGKFDLYLGEVRLAGDLDPSALVAPDGPLNYGGYGDPELPALLHAFQMAQGEQRIAAGRALHARLAEQAPLAVLGFKNWSLLTHRQQVPNLTATQQNPFYAFSGWTIRS